MATKLTEAEVREILGDEPEEFWRKQEEFRRCADRFYDNYDAILEEHAEKWVAVYGNQILAADTIEALCSDMDRMGIPRGEAFTHFVTKKKRILIL